MGTLRSMATVAIMFGLTGCSPGCTDQRDVAKTLPAVTDEQQQVGVTGIPIDSDRKTVVVVTPPGAARNPQDQMSELKAQNARSEARITSQMETYAGQLADTGAKGRIASQMNEDLEAYKKQSLEMYKLQQQMPGTPTPRAE